MKTHSLVGFLAFFALCLGAPAASAQVLAQYGFENNVIDASGNGHNGTNFNVGYATGIIGSTSGTFNGTSSYVDCGDNTLTSTLKPTLPITVTAWVNLASTANSERIFSGDNSDNSSTDTMMAGYDLGIAAGGLPECDFGDAGGWGSGHRQSLTGTAPLATGQWYHIAAVIQGAGNMQLYVNGQLINGNYSGAGGAMQYTTAPSRIGTSNSGSFFSGKIDDVRVYHAALTQTQIAQIAVGALGYWAFEEGTGTTTSDATGDGFTGTLTNGPQWTTGLDGSALAFNGTNSYVNFGNSTATNTLKQALPISISGLVFLNSTNGVQRIFSGDNTDNSSIIAGYDLSVVNGQLVGEFGDAQGAFTAHRRSNTGTIALAANQWYDVSAVIQNATNITLYVNGVNATGANSGSGGSIGYTSTSSKVASSGTTSFVNGKLQDIGVYNTAITPFQAGQAETVGGGTTNTPAVGPPPSFGVGGTGFTLVKNWHFGTDGTITNSAALDANFQYHDEFNTIDNGGNYGALTVATSTVTRIAGQNWVGETTNSVVVPQVRAFTQDSMQTYLVPLGGTATLTPANHQCGCGSFQPIWSLPAGGSRLGQDILWETRVRYHTPPYFWFALWVDGGPVGSNYAPEMDVLESFGYTNAPGFTNYDGRYWHSNTVSNGTNDFVIYQPNASWQQGMQSVGINSYDATQYHVWQLLYRKDNSYTMYADGTPVQWGPSYNWTENNTTNGTSVPMYFRYDAGLGANNVSSVDYPTAASTLNTNSIYYEFNYSRVYLR